jgi:uncharacterized protein (TIGR02444 family)
MTLWDWAVRAYAAPGAQTLLLKLQDEQEAPVCLLLWSAWAAAEGRAVDTLLLARADDVAQAWEQRVLQPLRSARRALKDDLTGAAPADRQALRARIGEDELAAERLLLDALEAVTPAPAGAPRPMAEALIAAAADRHIGAACVDLESLSRIFEAAGS